MLGLCCLLENHARKAGVAESGGAWLIKDF